MDLMVLLSFIGLLSSLLCCFKCEFVRLVEREAMDGSDGMLEAPGVRPEFLHFDWRSSASEYVLHKKMMPDYFRSYVHCLAAYRGIDEESLDVLRNTLIALSESPQGKSGGEGSIMPPNISGMVRNLCTKYPCFDLESLLSQREDLFRLSGRQVTYLHSLQRTSSSSSQEARRRRLQHILAEGLFLYFLAKFYHQDEFPLKISYYSRSEPVKTCLLYATGCTGIKEALLTYLQLYPEVFLVDPEVTLLKLKKTFRHSLRRYIDVKKGGGQRLKGGEDKAEQEEEQAQRRSHQESPDFKTLGIVSGPAKNDPFSCLIRFLHFPKTPPALLQLSRRSQVPKEGTTLWITAKNKGTPEEPAWIVLSYSSIKGEEAAANSHEEETFGLLEDVRGRIRSILSPRSAIIRFTLRDAEEEAYLNVNQACVGACLLGGVPLDVLFEKDDPVRFDAVRQSDIRGVRFRVCRLIPEEEEEDNHHHYYTRELLSKIESFLGGKPAIRDPSEDLVLSVLKWGTSDLLLPKFLINTNVLEGLLSQLWSGALSRARKEEFLLSLEGHVRKILVKLIRDYSNRRRYFA